MSNFSLSKEFHSPRVSHGLGGCEESAVHAEDAQVSAVRRGLIYRASPAERAPVGDLFEWSLERDGGDFVWYC